MKDKVLYARGCFELYHLLPKFPGEVSLDNYHRVIAHALECDRFRENLKSRLEKATRGVFSKPFEKLTAEDIIFMTKYGGLRKIMGR